MTQARRRLSTVSFHPLSRPCQTQTEPCWAHWGLAWGQEDEQKLPQGDGCGEPRGLAGAQRGPACWNPRAFSAPLSAFLCEDPASAALCRAPTTLVLDVRLMDV